MTGFVEELITALRSEKLQVTDVQPNECWSVPFDIDGKQYTTLIFNGRGTSYFLIMCPVLGLPWSSINDATIEELRRIIRLGSAVRLARLEYHEGENVSLFIAVSECSTENFTGLKLRRRMEACAQLAAKMRSEFPEKKSD
jgi:hypothetical protein